MSTPTIEALRAAMRRGFQLAERNVWLRRFSDGASELEWEDARVALKDELNALDPSQ